MIESLLAHAPIVVVLTLAVGAASGAVTRVERQVRRPVYVTLEDLRAR